MEVIFYRCNIAKAEEVFSVFNQTACNIFKEQEGEGNIINFASDTASTGMPGGALYATSKGTVYSWTRTIAYEWALKYNVRANCVNPTMKTPMH